MARERGLADGVNREGQEPWSEKIIERMPHGTPLDAPNGVARYEGQSPDAGHVEFHRFGWRVTPEWPKGNRSGE